MLALETRTLMRDLKSDVVVLAGTREVRIVGSTHEAETELASGFRPAVVLMGPGVRAPVREEFASRMGTRPSQARIPVLAVSGSPERLRLTLVSAHDDAEYPSPDQLAEVMMVLDELASELCALERWRRRDGEFAMRPV
jgi:hypothetical protein